MNETQTNGMAGLPTDGEIVAAILSGRRELFRVLVRRHQDTLYGHAVRMVGDNDEAAEIVQRAFVKGFNRLSTCQDPERVGGWLFRIASNLCKDYLKSRRRKDVSFHDLGVPVEAAENPAEDLRRGELRSALAAAIQQLAPGHREAFLMKHVEGYSYEGMAERMGVSVSALKMRVMRAREELQGLLAHVQPLEGGER